jgi:hypothetical protein
VRPSYAGFRARRPAIDYQWTKEQIEYLLYGAKPLVINKIAGRRGKNK